ncbi:MAG: rod shape-determining protein RodA [Candidatus Marinimicrobia bacterium]|nr:rod shape-determining protein RodA [Candidatus Neomarinimicrobiota bacterium]
MNNFVIKIREVPKHWFFIALVLTGFGLLTLYSISYHSETSLLTSRFIKQIFWLGGGFLIFLVTFSIPRRIIHKYSYLAVAVVFIMLFLPYVTGKIAGTYRWIQLSGFTIQPSELLKWLIIIALARYLSDHNLQMDKFRSTLLPIIFVLIPTAIVAKQPDLGSAIILFAPTIPLLYWAGARPLHIFLVIAPVISVVTAFNLYTFSIWILAVGVVLYLSKSGIKIGLINFFLNVFIGLFTPFLWNQLQPYQKERVLVLIDLSRDPYGAGYQLIQSITAIGSGGFLGKGFGNGTQTHLKFLPEQETDFIFSVIGEEFGFVIVVLILILFAVLIWKIIKTSFVADERFSSLVLIGIATILLSHVFVNVGMTVNLLPVKGLPLPFLSYGGSFLISCFAMLGLAMNMTVEDIE